MRIKKFIGDGIKTIEVQKSKLVLMRILSLKFQGNLNSLRLFCVSFANSLASSDY